MRRVWSLLLVPLVTGIEFSSFKPSEQYKCGSFLKGRVEDQALGYYYSAIHQFVDWVSLPFPHKELLNNEALQGDLNEWKDSFENKYMQWVQWEQWWLGICGGVLVISVLFPIIYLLYRCCLCCCGSDIKKQTTDSQYDGCKRNILNIVIAVLVIIDVFAASTLLVTGQYAEYGLEELPNRLNHCVDDLNLYRRDTDMKIRKLLIDDFSEVNRTLIEQISHGGHAVVDRVKKVTGAHAIDVFLNITSGAQEVRDVLADVKAEVRALNEGANKFAVEFGRLRKTAEIEISQCTHNEADSLKTMCMQAQRLLDNIASIRFGVDTDLLDSTNEMALSQVADSDVAHLLSQSNAQFVDLERELQKEIDKKVYSAQNMLKMIADDLFAIAERISTQIRQVNFDGFYNVISMYSEAKNARIKEYVHYSWYASLVVTALVVLISLCFLFGVFYGICGRRPTFYNDDCCVRSTGSKFFSCGIWISIFLFTILSIMTVVLMFAFGNVTHLVCNPMRDPLSRPDIMSLAERYVDMYKTSEGSNPDFTKLMESRSPVELVRACSRNETFYQIFEFDKKFHLSDLKKYEKDAFSQLEHYLSLSLSDLPITHPIGSFVSKQELDSLHQLSKVNISHLSSDGLAKLKTTINSLDLMSQVKSFTSEADNQHSGRPKAVSTIVEQIEELDTQIAKPLRSKLEVLYKNLTALDSRLQELQVPVASLVGKLEHAQALLSQDVKSHLEQAAKDVLKQLTDTFNQYVQHVKFQMENDVSSCAPVADIARNSRAALCAHTVDPLNGAWMSLLISLLVTIPIIMIGTTLMRLYNKMHSFPKYIVHEPTVDHQMSSFITDTYDTRMKPGYPNYSYTDDYQRTYR